MSGIWQYWWLVFPLGGIASGWWARFSRYAEKRRQHKLEVLRIKHGLAGGSAAEAAGEHAGQTARTRIDRVLEAHAETDRRWFHYETDLQEVLDHPMMTDLREPLTADFHRARVAAENLRPADPAELEDPALFTEYRDAVNAYRVAFDIAEREARRRRHADYSPAEQEALARARKLLAVAADQAATPAERQSAYRRLRQELDGVLIVPERAAAALERQVAGVLEAGRPDPDLLSPPERAGQAPVVPVVRPEVPGG